MTHKSKKVLSKKTVDINMAKKLSNRCSVHWLATYTAYICTLVFILQIYECDGLCTFPADFHNSVWTSTNFETMTFTTSNVTVTAAKEFASSNPSSYLLSWECFNSSSMTYILRSTASFTSFGLNVYAYYCLILTKQNNNSYYYETNTVNLPDSTSLSLSDTRCQSSNSVSSLNVMIKSSAATQAKELCAEPILGSFTHTVNDSTNAGCTNGTWGSACDTDKSTVTVSYQTSSCNPQVLIGYSSEGTLFCILATQSSNTYYQILYNPGAITGTETKTFACLTITTTNTLNDGNTSVLIEQRTCDDRQGASPIQITLTSDVLCPVVEEVTTTPDPTDKTPIIIGVVIGSLLFLILIGVIIFLCIYCNRDPNAGKPIIENTKPRFEDPDLEETIEDLEMMENSSTPVTRDGILVDALSPTNLTAGRPIAVSNGNVVNMAPGREEDWLNRSMNGGLSNGYIGKDIGNYFHEKPGDRPAPRINKLTPGKESMVIFNGDEKVISGNDSRVIPNENPSARSMRMDPSGVITFKSIDEEGTGYDYMGRISSENIGELPYPSIPREKSNLMPPIETIDSPKDKH